MRHGEQIGPGDVTYLLLCHPFRIQEVVFQGDRFVINITPLPGFRTVRRLLFVYQTSEVEAKPRRLYSIVMFYYFVKVHAFILAFQYYAVLRNTGKCGIVNKLGNGCHISVTMPSFQDSGGGFLGGSFCYKYYAPTGVQNSWEIIICLPKPRRLKPNL